MRLPLLLALAAIDAYGPGRERVAAVSRAAGAHVDPAITQGGSGVGFLGQIVDAEHLPLGAGLEHRHLAIHVGQEHLVVGGHRRGVVFANRIAAAALLRELAAGRIDRRDDPSIVYQNKVLH